MSDDRNTQLWPWIVALLIGLPVLYVASFGPACWLADRYASAWNVVWDVYYPLAAVTERGPARLSNALMEHSSEEFVGEFRLRKVSELMV